MNCRPSRLIIVLGFFALLPLISCESVGQMVVTRLSPMDWHGHSQIDVPLTFSSGGHLRVPVRIMGHDAMAFIDTGAPMPTMSRPLVDVTGVKVSGSLKANGRRYPAAEDVPLELGSASFKLGMVVVHDFAESEFLFGGGLFLQAVVDMDIDAGRLALIHPEAFVPPAEEPVRTGRWKMRPTVQIQINGIEGTICASLDTGFDGGVALMPEVVSRLDLLKEPGRVVSRVRFDGSQVDAPALAPLDEVRIGSQTYRNVQVMGEVPYEAGDCSNLIGMAVLSQHRVIFDVKKNRAWFLPRT